MKKLITLLFICLMGHLSNGQNCNFTFSVVQSNTVQCTSQSIYNTSPFYIIWDFGDGSSYSAVNPTHVYANPGTYIITQTVMDSANGATICSNVNTVLLNFCVVNFQQVSNTSMFNFNTIPSGVSTATWDFGDSSATMTGDSVTHAYNAPGTYTVTVSQYDLLQNLICSSTVQVQYNPNSGGTCSFTAIPDSTNSVYTFYATLSSPTSTVQWIINNGITFMGSVFTYPFTVPGIYTVCMNELSGGAIICSQCQVININSSPACAYSSSINPQNPFEVSFSPNSFSMLNTYLWDFGDGIIDSTNAAPTHTYLVNGNYTVCLYTYQGGVMICSACNVITISSGSICQANFAHVSVGLTAYFIDQSVPSPNTTNSYLWDFGDGNHSSLQFPQHQYSLPGTYTTCLTTVSGTCTSVFCDTVLIDTTAINPSSCNAYFIFTQTTPYQLIGVNLSTGFNITFMWNFGDGSPSSTLAYPSHQYSSTGTYNVCLTIADPNGCVSSYCDSLTVDSLGNIIYRGLTTGGFTLNIESPAQVTTGINNASTTTIGSVYPNPASDNLNIILAGNTKSTVAYKINSIDGKNIMNGLLNHASNIIDIKSIDSGIYLLEIIAADGSQNVKRFVKQ